MTNYKKRISLLTFVLTLILILSTFWTSTINVAYAEGETVYSNVLDDLKRDEKFSVEDFPTVVGDYSLQLVQVAESTDNKLFIYVYQPASPYKELTATSVRMTAQRKLFDRETLKYVIGTDTRDWNLTLVSREGTLCKYLVKGYTVLSNNTVRSYEIIQFLRPFDSDIDTQLDNGNIITEVSCPISEKVTFTKVGDTTMVDKVGIETIQITDKYVGFLRQKEGSSASWTYYGSDVHFVAFSTDRKIDSLLSATITFSTQELSYLSFPTDSDYGQVIPNEKSLSSTSKLDVEVIRNPNGLFSRTVFRTQFDEIQTISSFLEKTQSTIIYKQGTFSSSLEYTYDSSALDALRQTEYVLTFLSTPYYYKDSTPSRGCVCEKTLVSEVSILTLEFLSNGDIYLMGVIDNKQTGSEDPSGEGDINYLPPDIDLTWLYVVLGIVVLLILVSIIIRITNFFRLKDISYRLPKQKKRKRK
ncbi:MAG: hypothetical protein J6Q52_00210 [Clostridia bacterium]|nr:hypothetical protein [Clostridia bacterium]